MNLTRLAVNRPVTTVMVSLALMFLGVVSYRELSVQRLPDITFPSMYYYAQYVGQERSPEDTNDSLTRPIEKMVASLPGVKEMQSYTSGGSFWGYCTFERGTDMRFRVIELQDRIAKMVAGVKDKIVYDISPQSTSDLQNSLMSLILTVPIGEEDKVPQVSDLISRKLRSIDGITKVDIQGETTSNVMLKFERDDLLAKGLDVANITQAIDGRSQEKQWLGTLRDGRRLHEVQLASRIENLRQLLSLRIDANRVFTLGSLASVDKKAVVNTSIYRIDGKKGMHITISKEKERNTIQMAHAVRARIKEIEAALPDGFGIIVMSDEAKDLEDMIANLSQMAEIGAALAMLVLLIFTRSWRIALIVGVTIPAAVVVTFNAMYAAGLSINILSLLGLAAGVGMLVDNAIVVVQNVFRLRRLGHPPREAAWMGSREVGRAILVSTLTNIIVFMPLVFLDDNLVLLMKEMALSLVFPMTMSLLIAVTLVPVMSARMIRAGAPVERVRQPLSAQSRRVRWNPWQPAGRPPRNPPAELVMYLTKGSIRHPVRLFFTIIGMLLATLLISIFKINIQQYQLNSESRELVIYGKTPLGSDLAAADAFFQAMETKVRKAIEGSDVFEYFTSSFDKSGGEIHLKVSDKYIHVNRWMFQAAYRTQFTTGSDNSGFRLYPYQSAGIASASTYFTNQRQQGQEQVIVTGENMDAMRDAANEVQKLVKEQPDVAEVFQDAPSGSPELHFKPDIEMFQIMKADPQSLQSFFNARSSSGIDTSLTLRENGLPRQVRLKVADADDDAKSSEQRHTLGELKKTKIALAGGGQAPLEMLGNFSMQTAVPSIAKKNRQRNMTVTFNFTKAVYSADDPKAMQARLLRIQNLVAALRMPAGVSAAMGGTLQGALDTGVQWRRLMGLAVLAVYLTMAFFFDSLVSPLIILCVLPLAAVGGVWGLIFFRAEFNEVAMVGTILLAGLVVNPSILLIEFIQQMERGKGFRRSRALLSSVNYRLQPIAMTTLTTILGLLPILMTRDADKEARSLVSVLIGGILISALLTMIVIPTLYNVFAILQERLAFKWRRAAARLSRGSGRVAAMPALAGEAGLLGAPAMRTMLPGRYLGSGQIAGDAGRTPAVESVAPGTAASLLHLSISIENVSKTYAAFNRRKLLNFLPSRRYPWGRRPVTGNVALKEVSMQIEQGMFGLLGPNGAGKTTLMKIITGVVEQSFGVVKVGGLDLRDDRQSIRRLIGYLPQNFGVYEALSVDQYLEFFAPFYGLHDRARRRQRIDECIEMVGLGQARGKPMKRFSGGMRQRAGIAQILLSPPAILIVDEPTAGLDPVERVRFRLLLSELARTRIVLLSTHIVDDITSSCRQVAVLNRGEMIYRGDLQEIKAAGEGVIWDVLFPAGTPAPLPRRSVIYRKHVGDQILYHYYARDPLPGSAPVPANFEDAYVALLMGHEMSLRG